MSVIQVGIRRQPIGARQICTRCEERFVSLKTLVSWLALLDPAAESLAGLQIAKRRRAHQEKHPDAHVISLGIGDTTEPITSYVADAMKQAAEGLGTRGGYSG